MPKHIEAVVVCVDYADYLQVTLPLLAARVDRVIVITSSGDLGTANVVREVENAELVVSECFYDNGATFNKGAAINLALRRLNRRGWVLIVDADIAVMDTIPIPDGREQLWGARRFRVVESLEWKRLRDGDRSRLQEIPVPNIGGRCPLGYFQMWHWPTRPLFYPEDGQDASKSDIAFARNWDPQNRQMLSRLSVYHLETVDSHKGANWAGRTTSAFRSAPLKPRGILTGANQNYWPTLRLLVQSCRDLGIDVAVADHGLTREQRAWLEDQEVILPPVPHGYGTSLPGHGHQYAEPPSAREAWLKPLLCLNSVFEHTIWIDADAVPLRGLDGMFQRLREGPWLTLESWTDDVYARQMYLMLVRHLVGHIPDCYAAFSQINTGVFGFRRGDAWICEWAKICKRILLDPGLLACCRLRDQAALVALLCGAGALNEEDDHPHIADDRSLNWPANGCSVKDRRKRKRYQLDAADCLERLRADHPQIAVVHWMGNPKPWNIE